MDEARSELPPYAGLREALEASEFDPSAIVQPASFSFVGPEGENQSIAVLPVGTVSGQLLVAVPHGAWHRQGRNRRLPAGSFAKPFAVEVAALADEEFEAHPVFKVKVWLGLLRPNREAECSYEEAPSLQFLYLGSDTPASLLEAVRLRFTFQSAESGEPKGAEPAPPAPGLADRVSKIETCLSDLQLGMSQLLQHASVPAEAPSARGVVADPSAFRVPGFDPETVAAAHAAGVPASQLAAFSRLACSVRSLFSKTGRPRASRPARLGEERANAASSRQLPVLPEPVFDGNPRPCLQKKTWRAFRTLCSKPSCKCQRSCL